MFDAIFVPDFETSAHGRNFNVCRMLGGGAVVIEPQRLLKYFDREGNIKPITKEVLDDIIPPENRFRAYVHDEDAIREYEESAGEGPIWKEIKGQEFWMKPQNKDMFQTAFNEMKKSTLNQEQFTRALNAFLNKMIAKYGKLIFASDTTNFDFPMWDHYKRTYIDSKESSESGSINHATPNGFVLPLDTTSFYFGLTRQKLTLDSWDTFGSAHALISAGYRLPLLGSIIDPNSHDPLQDAIGIAIRLAAVICQLG